MGMIFVPGTTYYTTQYAINNTDQYCIRRNGDIFQLNARHLFRIAGTGRAH